MNPTRSLFVLAALAFASASVLTAADPAARPAPASPADTITETINGNVISITYGRPYTKDPKTGEMRKVWGKLVPYGAVWRTGANTSTKLTISQPLEIGGTTLPAGSYSLYTDLAADGSAKLIVNKKTGQWGINRDGSTTREPAEDAAQVAMVKEPLSPQLDQFTMAVVKKSETAGIIALSWEQTKYSAPFTVKK